MRKKSNKCHYSWWPYIREIIREYPEGLSHKDAHDPSRVKIKDFESVREAIIVAEREERSRERLKVIKMVHWDRTHTLEGAALEIPCDRSTVARWQRKFFEEVARNRGLLN